MPAAMASNLLNASFSFGENEGFELGSVHGIISWGQYYVCSRMAVDRFDVLFNCFPKKEQNIQMLSND